MNKHAVHKHAVSSLIRQVETAVSGAIVRVLPELVGAARVRHTRQDDQEVPRSDPQHPRLAALPFLNAAHAAHPAFGRSVKELRDAGVKVLLGSEGYEPHVPHQGSKYLARYPWHVVLAAVETDRG